MFKQMPFHNILLGLLALGALMPLARPAFAAPAACRAWHTVQRGETLYRIGLKYNLTWDRILQANAITSPDKIYAGQVLCIPASEQWKPTPDIVIVLPTDVQYVMTLTDVNMRVGPGMEFAVMGKVFDGQTAKVTGVSGNGLWWRVICPDNTVGNCWITASARYTQPTAGQPAPDVVIVLPTHVQYVIALRDVNMRVGPGLEFARMSMVAGGQTAKVTGISSNGLWWRVICPDNTEGNCWITASARYTQPTG